MQHRNRPDRVEGATLLVLKMEEGATNQGIGWHFEARKGKEMGSFLEPLEGHRCAGTLISAPEDPSLDFGLPEPEDDQPELSRATSLWSLVTAATGTKARASVLPRNGCGTWCLEPRGWWEGGQMRADRSAVMMKSLFSH